MPQRTPNRRVTTTAPSNNTEIKKVRYSKKDEPSFYKCHWCGTPYKGLDDNFPASQSDLYAGLDYHLPICRRCLNNMFEHYTEVYGGDEDAAIRRICEKYDIYYCTGILDMSKKANKKNSRIHTYISKSNLNQYKGKTYDTTLDEERNANTIISEARIEELGESDAKKLLRNIKRWGIGYEEAEYDMLNDHYKLYKDSIDESNATQVTLLNDLCEQFVLKARARQDKDMDRYEKVSKLYQQTLGNANLKPRGLNEQSTNNPDECWGNFIRLIETISPAEYFKDKKIFKDYDEQDQYYRRFIERPTNNLINGTTVMDEEYSIEVTDDE